MSRQNGISLHRIGRRCIGHVAGAMLQAALAMLPWAASAELAKEAPREDALVAPGKAGSPTPQPAISEAKSPDKAGRPIDESSPAPRITGVVVGPDGKPAEGAAVYLFVVQKGWHPAFADRLHWEASPIEQFMPFWFGQNQGEILGRARTDDAGRFAIEFRPVAPDCYFPGLLVTAEGLGLAYQSLVGSGIVEQELQQAAEDFFRVQLSKMAPIRGRLLKPDGTPAQGVLVWVRQLAGVPRYNLYVCHCRLDSPGAVLPQAVETYLPEFWPRAVTDSDGVFTLEGMPEGCCVYLTLLHPDFAVESLAVGTRPSETKRAQSEFLRFVRPDFSHTLRPAHIVEGVITAADTGKPLAGVVVRVSASVEGALRRFPIHSRPGWTYGRTDQQGRYRVNCPPGEQYGVTVYPPPGSGYLCTSIRGESLPGGGLTRDIRLVPGTIVRGRVLDEETAKPISGASVIYLPFRGDVGMRQTYGPFYRNPALTDDDGRFAVTVPSHPGHLSVEASDRSYLRRPDDDHLVSAGTAAPMSLTAIDVRRDRTFEEEVTIRLRRGRTVVLHALGPEGERLPWVRATCVSAHALHDSGGPRTLGFGDGRAVLRGLDPNCKTRVFLAYPPRKLGAVFDITPETAEGPVEVRLQPTGTILGRMVTPDGDPEENGRTHLMMSFDPEVSQFSKDRVSRYSYYSKFFSADSAPLSPGEFTIEHVLSGVPFGLLLGWLDPESGVRVEMHIDMMTVEPLAPGEQRDMGELVVARPPTSDSRPRATTPGQPKRKVDEEKLLLLVGRIGIVPDLSKGDTDQPLELFVLPGSPAEKAGIRSGDRVTAINGRPVKRIEEAVILLSRLLSDDALGRSLVVDGLRLSLLREGKQVEAKLTSDLLPGFFGPKVKPLGDELFEVTFTYQPKKPAEAVYLAGSFNDWKPTAHKMDGPDQEGRFTTRLKLKKGRYEYKFVLDGQAWQTDPENVLQTGPYRNSVLHVAAEP